MTIQSFRKMLESGAPEGAIYRLICQLDPEEVPETGGWNIWYV